MTKSNLLRHVLLMAFVAIGTITAQPCNFCTDGELPLNSDLVIFFQDDGNVTTCNDAVELVNSAPADSCNTLYNDDFDFVCGCPGTEPGGVCTGICQEGFVVTLPDDPSGIQNEDGSDKISCFVLDQLLLATTDSNNCDRFTTETYRTTCGCAEKCTFCPDGAEPLGVKLPSGKSFPFLEGLCANEIEFTSGGKPDCVDQVETGFASLCGCPKAALPSDAVKCTLCTDGSLPNPSLVLPGDTFTCESANFYVSIANKQVCD